VYADEEPAIKSGVPAADGAVAASGVEPFFGVHEIDYAS